MYRKRAGAALHEHNVTAVIFMSFSFSSLCLTDGRFGEAMSLAV